MPKIKKALKKKLKKAFRGSISILLCLLVTPFMTIALGLVEYSRYQSLLELTDELYELTGISLLSDYDPYLHSRFGLMATNQENALGDGMEELLTENIDMLGKQISVNNMAIRGDRALTNEDILRQQVLDVSELTATAAVVADDFKLQELLEKLNNLDQFQQIMDTVDSLADLTEKIGAVVDSLEVLEDSLNTLNSSINNAASTARTLSQNLANFYNKLMDEGISLSASPSQEQIEAVMALLTDDLLSELKGLYSTAKSLMNQLGSIKSNVTQMVEDAEAFVKAVEEAQKAAENLNTESSVDQEGQLSETAKEGLEDVLEEMADLVEDTLEDVIDTAEETVNEVIDEIINGTVESVGLKGYTTRYWEIVNGSYFSTPLTETAKADLVDLIQAAKSCYDNKGADGMVSYFRSKFVPDINIDFGDILDDVGDALSDAKDKFSDTAGDKVGELLTKLVNIVKGLFDLDVFYEADMNAFVDIASGSAGGYQLFLNAVGDLFTAIEDFGSAIKGAKFRKMLTALGEMLWAIGDMMQAIMDVFKSNAISIGKLLTSDVGDLYEKLLIAGYMRHNLPCRLNSGEYSYASGSMSLDISGEGLTGFSYNDIVRPAYGGQSVGFASGSKTMFERLSKTLDNIKNGAGSDTMFRGAELEYIRVGTNSEVANQIIVFFDIYFLRLLLDLPSIFLDSEVAAVAGAATIAAWVVYILYILAEPFCDTILLVNNVEVPLIRSDCWLTATGLGTFVNKLAEATMSEALLNDVQDDLNDFTSSYAGGSADPPKTNMNTSPTGGGGLANAGYQTHVLILLMIYVEDSVMISRFQDLVELESKAYYAANGGSFSMAKTYTAIELTADASFDPLLDLSVLNGGSPWTPETTVTQTISY